MHNSNTYNKHLQHKKDPWGITEVDGRIATPHDQLTQHDRRGYYFFQE